MTTQVFLEDTKLETHKNIPYNHYVFTYRIIWRKKFEWKCDQLLQELLNCGTIIRGKSSFYTYAFLKGNYFKHNNPIEVTTNQAFKKFKLRAFSTKFVFKSFQGQMTCNIPKSISLTLFKLLFIRFNLYNQFKYDKS